jgi:hypothetical protein
MKKTAWDRLTEELREAENPRRRRRACRKLVATGDPAVIPFLRNAYLQDDHEAVRDAAREGLAFFKARQAGRRTRRYPPGRRFLRALAGLLAILLLASLALNALALWGEDGATGDGLTSALFEQPPTPREGVIALVEERLGQAAGLAASLRAEIASSDATGQLACDQALQVPEPVGLADIDQITYPDLNMAAMRVDAALPALQKALLFFQNACSDPAIKTERILASAIELDTVEAHLKEASETLQEAIVNPAPTFGPTVTPLPTDTASPTLTPAPTLTLTPGTPALTAPPAEIAPPTATPTATASPAPTRTPTPAPSPAPTLPFPALDYRTILPALRERYAVMADLKNNFRTGMIDQWEQALSAQGQTSVSFCRLAPWPALFALTPEQQSLLNAPGVADSQLEETIRLQQEGLRLALEARTLYEASCAGYNLAGTAQQGLALANEALARLTESQHLYDLIRARPSE